MFLRKQRRWRQFANEQQLYYASILLIIRVLNLQMQNSYLILDEYVSINLRVAER